MARRNAAKTIRRKPAESQVFTRFMLVVVFILLWAMGIGARLVYLQVVQAGELKNMAESQRREVKKERLPRGTIFDRDARVLAISTVVKTLYADPFEIDDIGKSAREISKATGLKVDELKKLLEEAKADGKRWVPLMKGLDEPEVQKINNALERSEVRKADLPKFAGLHWSQELSRKYPQGTLAAHVVGFSNKDGVGQAGIEQSQNDDLFGETIKAIRERDRLGRVYDEKVSDTDVTSDVYLTIRSSVQYKTEQALEKAVKNSGAASGIAIVIDHKTGEILAMANYPTFDPNKLSTVSETNLSNRAIQMVYSPGSVFKLITYAAAIERGFVSPDGMIDAGNGIIEVAGHRFRDSHSVGTVTYAKALAHSSNVCAIKTGLRVGKENFYETLKRFGFGSRTGIELPAEISGIVRNPARWNGDSLASMSIGYEIGVSALQMATAFATIANNGVRIQPHILKEIRTNENQPIDLPTPQQDRIVSAETAQKLKIMLREVVQSGTGKKAQSSLYTTAGKTGTAWKFDEKTKKVSSSKYISSFMGFAPADNPQVTVAVVVDEPKVGGRDGGQVAAPVFREIIDGVLSEMNVAPDNMQGSAEKGNTYDAENDAEKNNRGETQGDENPAGLDTTNEDIGPILNDDQIGTDTKEESRQALDDNKSSLEINKESQKKNSKELNQDKKSLKSRGGETENGADEGKNQKMPVDKKSEKAPQQIVPRPISRPRIVVELKGNYQEEETKT
jgi:cell division protein FtsI (penicillin-binding protein 3)